MWAVAVLTCCHTATFTLLAGVPWSGAGVPTRWDADMLADMSAGVVRVGADGTAGDANPQSQWAVVLCRAVGRQTDTFVRT
jgi:hypothetical protein